MTPHEFHIWIAGFIAAAGDTPTADQWSALKEKVAEIRDPGALVRYHPPGQVVYTEDHKFWESPFKYTPDWYVTTSYAITSNGNQTVTPQTHVD